jgi:hypothetical protein
MANGETILNNQLENICREAVALYVFYIGLLIDHADGASYISVLRPPTGLLFIPQVIRACIWACRTMVDDSASWGKLLTHPPVLSGNPTTRVIWEQVGEINERSENFTFQAFHSKMQVIFTCRKVLWHGVSGFTSPPKEGLLVPEAARCKTQLLATWLSGSRVRITLEAWMSVYMLCCPAR